MKRARACESCHSIKIRCELGTDGGEPPCKRCARLGRDCIISVPKRQKDRVAQLEAQVEALTRLLKSQTIHADATEAVETNSPTKTKTTSQLAAANSTSKNDATSGSSPCEMDEMLDVPTQKAIFERYVKEMTPIFTLVPLIPTCAYETLRAAKPLLLQAIIYAACHGVLTQNVQDGIARILLDKLVSLEGSQVPKSLEVIQASLLVIMWYRYPRFYTNVTLQRLVDLAIENAKDLGISGTDNAPVNVSRPMIVAGDSAEVCRAWLVCYLSSANLCNIARQKNPLKWSFHEDSMLLMLDYSMRTSSDDRLLAQYVRAERLCEQIAIAFDYLESTTCIAIDNATVQSTIEKCSGLIRDWKAQIPSLVSRSYLEFWEYAAVLRAHEYVLHTDTNKASFTGPYVAERISITDFPKPTVTSMHIQSFTTMQDNSHALLRLFSSLDTVTIMALPPILFASRVVYCQWILLRLYVASTGSENTLGSHVDPHTLRLDHYLYLMAQVHYRVCEIDADCAMARVLQTAARSQEWLQNYRDTSGIEIVRADQEQILGHGHIPDDFDLQWNYTDMVSNAPDYDFDGFLGTQLSE